MDGPLGIFNFPHQVKYEMQLYINPLHFFSVFHIGSLCQHITMKTTSILLLKK